MAVHHDPLRKDIFGGTVHAEERSPGVFTCGDQRLVGLGV